jgi:phage terminase large subunit-like protein
LSDLRSRLAALPPGTGKAARAIVEKLRQLSPEDRQKLLAHFAANVAEHDRYHRFSNLFPDHGSLRRSLYRRHVAFFEATSKYTEVALLGGNRCAKSTTAAYALTVFLTGLAQPWWPGRVFPGPTNCWACATSSQVSRETIQAILLGSEGQPGTGLIPRDCIIGTTAKAGTAGAVDSVRVRHVSGGESRLIFKAYDARRTSFVGSKCSCIWMDEEAGDDGGIYSECLARLTATTPGERSGLLMCTYTPIMGLSAQTLKFLPGGERAKDEAA